MRHSTILLFALATVTATAGCEVTGSAIETCTEAYAAQCHFLHSCCNASERAEVVGSGFGVPMSGSNEAADILASEAGCLLTANDLCAVNMASETASVEEGRVVIDATALAECYAPMHDAASECDAASLAQYVAPDACDDVMAGAVAAGDECYENFECEVEGSRCEMVYCQDYWDCNMGETCYNGKCTDECYADDECTGTQVCDLDEYACVQPGDTADDTVYYSYVGTCLSPASPGDPCGNEATSGPEFCNPTSWCDAGTCKVYVEAGGECDGANPCILGDLYCHMSSNQCVTYRQDGDACNTADGDFCDASQNLTCDEDSERCTKPRVVYEYCSDE